MKAQKVCGIMLPKQEIVSVAQILEAKMVRRGRFQLQRNSKKLDNYNLGAEVKMGEVDQEPEKRSEKHEYTVTNRLIPSVVCPNFSSQETLNLLQSISAKHGCPLRTRVTCFPSATRSSEPPWFVLFSSCWEPRSTKGLSCWCKFPHLHLSQFTYSHYQQVPFYQG